MVNPKQLKLYAKNITLLYAEDNEKLRVSASSLFKKFFSTIYSAKDGLVAFEIFKKYKPDIVITDIRMPNMTGIELAKKIHSYSPNTKIIFMSAFDDKVNLMYGIEYGIFKFLKKPVNVNELVEVLYLAIKEIRLEKNRELFTNNLQNIFNYQSSMVLMLEDRKEVFANQVYLDFFDIESIEEFIKKYNDIGSTFLEHDGFLYNTPDKDWFEEVSANCNKLYHVKIKDKDDKLHHLLLKYQTIPEKNSNGILSFDDITELNLLKIFSNKDMELKEERESIIKLLEVTKRNNSKVTLFNYYKGLTITNDALISEVNDKSITLITNYVQEKVIQLEKQTFISSSVFPHPVHLSNMEKLSFEDQSVSFTSFILTKTSPVQRDTIRVVPESSINVSLFVGDSVFKDDIFIEDLSIKSVKVNILYLPAALKEGDKVIIDFVLNIDKQPVIINSDAILFRKSEHNKSFSLVFMFVYKENLKNNLVKYITKRQMAIIREFKGLKNG